jgi:L-threonylcarbamoyladenylate synthase
MHEPAFVVRADDRDAAGHLRPEHLERVGEILQDHGFVLLPSDTAYSLAAVLDAERVRQNINAILERPDDPISLAFSSVAIVQQWTSENTVADRLLERFTPGPITVVRTVSRHIPADLTNKVFRSQNRTIGVRIPNSVEERDVAAAAAGPVTTVAVRRSPQDPSLITTLDEAISIVAAGIARIGGATWCAIEGQIRYQQHSTVVEVLGEDGSYRLVREGSIPEAEIQACLEEQA